MKRLQRRTGRVGLAIVGVALGTAIVGIALAIVNYSFTGAVSSNEFAATTTTVPPTTTTTLPPGDGLEAAISTTGGGPSPCSNALAVGSLSLGSATIDLNSAGVQGAGLFLCTTNVLPSQVTTLTAAATVSGSTEDGCSADELTVDDDGSGTCGSLGELESVIEVVLTPFSIGDGSCVTSPIVISPGGGPVDLLFPATSGLSQGNLCSWDISYQVSGTATYEEKLAASTDSIALELLVSGSGS